MWFGRDGGGEFFGRWTKNSPFLQWFQEVVASNIFLRCIFIVNCFWIYWKGTIVNFQNLIFWTRQGDDLFGFIFFYLSFLRTRRRSPEVWRRFRVLQNIYLFSLFYKWFHNTLLKGLATFFKYMFKSQNKVTAFKYHSHFAEKIDFHSFCALT